MNWKFWQSPKNSAATGTAPASPARNDYTQLITQLKKLSPDWQVNRVGIDSEIYRNHFELRAYSRNLARENPYILGYFQDLCANVIGPNGYTIRMMIKEEEDRVIHTPLEKATLRAAQERRAQVFDFIARTTGKKPAGKKLIRE